MLNTFSKYNLQTAVINIGVVLLFVACMSIGLTASAQVRESGTVIVDNADVRIIARKLPAEVSQSYIIHNIELNWILKTNQVKSIEFLTDLYTAENDKAILYTLSNPSPVLRVKIDGVAKLVSGYLTNQTSKLKIIQEPNKSGDYSVTLDGFKFLKELQDNQEVEVLIPVKFESSVTSFMATEYTKSPIFHSAAVTYPKVSDPVIKVQASFMLKNEDVTKDCKKIKIGTVEWSTVDNEKIEEVYGSSCIAGPQKKELSYKVKDEIRGNDTTTYTIEVRDNNGRRYRNVVVHPNTDSYVVNDIQSIVFNKTVYQINPFKENELVDVFGRNGFSHEYTIVIKDGSRRSVRYFERVNGGESVDSRFIDEQKVLVQKLKEARRQPSFSKASIRSVTQTNRYSKTVAKDLAQTFEIELVNGRKYKIDTSLNDLQRFKNVLNTIGFNGTVNEIIDFDLTKTSEPTDLQDLVKELRDQLSTLNSGGPTSSVALQIGSVVSVTDSLRVRKSPSTAGVYIGTQPAGAKGKVVEGPLRAEGHTWFKVDYETGVDGWNASGWLKKMTDYEGEQDAARVCSYNGKNYKEGSTLTRPLLSTDINSDYPDLKEAEYKCRGGIWTLQDNSGPVYLFTDTESITKQDVDPNKSKSGDEYTLYKIVLKNNVAKHEVKIFKKMSKSVRDAEFRKTGYIGSVNNLIASARLVKDSNQINKVQNLEKTPSSEVAPTDVVTADEQVKKGATTTTPTSTPAPRFNTITNPTGIGETKVSAVFATTRSLKTGPIVFGTINWGDGAVTEPVSALVLGTETTVNLTHVYKRNGTYTITLTALDGKSATQKVIISKPTPSPTPKPLPVIPQPTPTPKPPVVTPAPKPTPVPPAAITSYTLTDISAVTKKLVDPNKAAIDDEYTLYTITLKNKKVHQVKVFGRQQPAARDANFNKTGYTGDVVKLMALAKAVTTPTPTLRPTATTTPNPLVKGATTDAYAEILETLNNISVMLEQNK